MGNLHEAQHRTEARSERHDAQPAHGIRRGASAAFPRMDLGALPHLSPAQRAAWADTMQRTHGNRATAGLLQAVSAHRGGASGLAIQAKLTVGAPDDAFEREADRIADHVMRMPVGSATIQRACAACGQKDDEDETVRRKPIAVLDASSPGRIMRLPADDDDFLASIASDSVSPGSQATASGGRARKAEEQAGAVQAKAHDGADVSAPPGLAREISTLAGRAGAPISNEARSFFEPRFGHDFSDVRIHADSETARVAEGLKARAFTLGRSIFFGASEYRPHTEGGQRLLAHELTHVLQQTGSRGAGASAVGVPSPSRIQRTPAETLARCPPYFEWDRSKSVNDYNCAGLAFRTYDFRGDLAAERSAATGFVAIPCGNSCRAGQIKHWFWEYDLHLEAGGIRLTNDNHDFHTVAGMFDPRGAEPTDVYTKNGHRPVHGPGTGGGFRPPASDQATSNDPSETPATVNAALSAQIGVPVGTPIMKVRTNYTDTCGCAQCPGFIGPPQLPP
jgi:hypothetical protein